MCQQKALASHERMGNLRGQGITLLNLGNLFLLSTRFEQAAQCYATALAACQVVGYLKGEADAEGNLGSLHLLGGRLDKAQIAHSRALDICRSIGDRLGEAERLGSLGAIRQQEGALEAAIDLQTQAINIVQQINQPDLTYRLLVSRGFSWSQLGNTEAMLTDFRAAVEIIENLRAQFADELSRSRFFSYDKMMVYREIVLGSARLDDTIQALDYVERSRSRTLLDLLSWTRIHVSSESASAEVQRERELRQSLHAIMLAQREAKAEPLRRSLALQHAALQEQLEAILEDLRQIIPEYVALRQAGPAGYAHIQQYIADIAPEL